MKVTGTKVFLLLVEVLSALPTQRLAVGPSHLERRRILSGKNTLHLLLDVIHLQAHFDLQEAAVKNETAVVLSIRAILSTIAGGNLAGRVLLDRTVAATALTDLILCLTCILLIH